MSWETVVEVRDGSGTLVEVRNGSVDPRGGPGLIGGPSGRFGTGWVTLVEVWDGLGTLEVF